MNDHLISQSPPLTGSGLTLSPVKISEFRNGIIVRMPDDPGHAVMALPALAALKNILPQNCGLFVATHANLIQLYQALTFVDDIVPLTGQKFFWSREERILVKRLRPGAAVLFNDSWRDAVCFKLAGIPDLFGESSGICSLIFKRKFQFQQKYAYRSSTIHQTFRYLAAAEALGGTAIESLMPEFKIPCAPDELSGSVAGMFYHPKLLIIAPGKDTGLSVPQPSTYYAKIATYWIRHGGTVVLCGNACDFEICEAIKNTLPEKKVINLCGRTNWFALMYLFRFAKFTISENSSLMHLAAALKCPGLTAFGSADPYETGPVSELWTILHCEEKHAPCSKYIYPKNTPVSVKKITPFKVIRILKKFI